MPSSSLHSPHLMELISQTRPPIAPRQQVMACVSQVLMQVDEETAKRWEAIPGTLFVFCPKLFTSHTCLRGVALPLNALKTPITKAYLLKLDKLWTLLRVCTDRAGKELQQEKGDHLAATTFPKHGGNGRLPLAGSSTQTHFAGKGSSNLTSSKRFSLDLQLVYASHNLYISLQHKGEPCSFLENNSHLQLSDDEN